MTQPVPPQQRPVLKVRHLVPVVLRTAGIRAAGPPNLNRPATRRTANCRRRQPAPIRGDGSNGANVLSESGILRSDITSSFGSSSTKAQGVPLAITMTIKDFANGNKPLTSGAVYLWHCNRDGQYSLYSEGVTGENYLRGVQETDGNGTVKFTTIFPGCYSGRWPHIHFEVYWRPRPWLPAHVRMCRLINPPPSGRDAIGGRRRSSAVRCRTAKATCRRR